MRRALTFTATLAALALAAGCGEKPPRGASGAGVDAPAYQGTGVASFTRPGWTAGDANSWQQQLRTRGQYGQNEYTRSATR